MRKLCMSKVRIQTWAGKRKNLTLSCRKNGRSKQGRVFLRRKVGEKAGDAHIYGETRVEDACQYFEDGKMREAVGANLKRR